MSSVPKLNLFEKDAWDKEYEDHDNLIDIQKGFGHLTSELLQKSNGIKTTFTRQGNMIQWERSQFKMSLDEIIRIDTEDAILYHYWTDEKGDPKFTSYPLHSEQDWEWEVKYDLQERPGNSKSILGYICELITINETKRNKKTGELSMHRYELYVTRDIGIPFEFTIPLWAKIDGRTALEIRIFPGNRKKAI